MSNNIHGLFRSGEDFFSAQVVKSRRHRPCSVCRTEIPQGSHYVCVSARLSGRYWSQWLHQDCYQEATQRQIFEDSRALDPAARADFSAAERELE